LIGNKNRKIAANHLISRQAKNLIDRKNSAYKFTNCVASFAELLRSDAPKVVTFPEPGVNLKRSIATCNEERETVGIKS